MMHNLLKVAKVIRLKPDGSGWTVAAGTSDTLNGDSVDMLGFQGVSFVAGFGTLTSTAVTTLKLQQSSDDGAVDGFSDIAGTAQSIADTGDNKMLTSEIYRPEKRYVRPVITRATANAVVDFVLAILWQPAVAPITEHATVAGSEFFNHPTEGTA